MQFIKLQCCNLNIRLQHTLQSSSIWTTGCVCCRWHVEIPRDAIKLDSAFMFIFFIFFLKEAWSYKEETNLETWMYKSATDQRQGELGCHRCSGFKKSLRCPTSPGGVSTRRLNEGRVQRRALDLTVYLKQKVYACCHEVKKINIWSH